MTRSLLPLILTAHLLCVLTGCHSVDFHRRPPSEDRPDPDFGMASAPVGDSFTNRLVPNFFFDVIYEAAQMAQFADR